MKLSSALLLFVSIASPPSSTVVVVTAQIPTSSPTTLDNVCSGETLDCGSGYIAIQDPNNDCQFFDCPVRSDSDDASKCTACTNDPTPNMLDRGKDCGTATDAIATRCNANPTWVAWKYCQLTCFFTGRGYEGDNCCEGGTVPPTVAPTADPTDAPVADPTAAPTAGPTDAPTDPSTGASTDADPTASPTGPPVATTTTDAPVASPANGTDAPVSAPTNSTEAPTVAAPSNSTTSASPTASPGNATTDAPTSDAGEDNIMGNKTTTDVQWPPVVTNATDDDVPTLTPTVMPTNATKAETSSPTMMPTVANDTDAPTAAPTEAVTANSTDDATDDATDANETDTSAPTAAPDDDVNATVAGSNEQLMNSAAPTLLGGGLRSCFGLGIQASVGIILAVTFLA